MKDKIKASEDWESEISTYIPQGFKIVTINNIRYWILEDEK